jgi:hypothetical protein
MLIRLKTRINKNKKELENNHSKLNNLNKVKKI